jgi:hypothetical protein
MCVKPDGSRLFIAWYDRRNDPDNSMIDVYARWGTIASDGSISFGDELQINTLSFPPVFAGTLTNNTIDGHYDPVYPPTGVNLHWWYPDWPADQPFLSPYASHVGEYNAAWASQSDIFMVWTDARLPSIGIVLGRYRENPEDPESPEIVRNVPLMGNQRDVRLARFKWTN